jgi:O-antigen/teichoic acid export membrane protein
MASLKEKTGDGLFWGGMNNLTQQLIGVVFGIILARLLSQSDYGMMAMIGIFSLVATALQDSGFKTALVNMDRPEHRDYNSVFWFNIIAGLVLYAILFFCAPLIARFYNNDALIPLCRYAFLSIMIASWGTAQNAWLFKNLRAKQQAKAAMAAVLLSSTVGAIMAFCGCSYWSLATQGLVYVSAYTLLAWHYSQWRPTITGITFEPVRRMFRFSCKILATSITTIINNNVLNILLGRYFGEKKAGVYNQAYQWDMKCFSLVQNMVNQVAQPVLVDLRSDRGRQLNAMRKMMRFTAFISFPLLLGFGLVAREFIVLTITEKWIESARLIQILCISGAVIPLSTLLSNMVISKGKSGIYLWVTLGLGVAQILTMVLISSYGLHTMVVAYVLLNILWLFIWHGFVWRLAGYSLLQFLRDTVPFALAATGVMAFVGLVTSSIETLWLLLCTRIVLAAAVYYAVMKVARVQILKECEQFAIRKFRK